MVANLRYHRLLPRPRQSFFLFGMRGVGRSTWARLAFPDAVRAARQELYRPTERERGPLLEGWVYMLLRAYGDPGFGLGRRHDGLFYWAPAEGGTKVDFVVRRGGEVVAIEVKAKRHLTPRDFRGLRAIADLEGLRRRVVVFLGDRSFVTDDGIDALPVAEFVRELEGRRI